MPSPRRRLLAVVTFPLAVALTLLGTRPAPADGRRPGPGAKQAPGTSQGGFSASVARNLADVPEQNVPPELTSEPGPFRRVNVSAEVNFAQALHNLLGPTRDPDEMRNPVCTDDCTRYNYRHLRTRHEDVQKQKIVVVLDDHCPREFDFDLEHFCNHPVAFEDNEKCATGLPYAYFIDFDHQREIKGYYKSAYTAVFRRSMPLMRQMGWDFDAIRWDNAKFEMAKHWGRPEMWPGINATDVIIASILHFRELVKVYPDKRYVLVSTNDAATLSTKLGCDIEDGRIIAVLQHTSLSPLAENNGALRGDRRHFMWFPANATRDKLVPTTYRIPELDREGGAKIQVLIPQVYRWKWPLDCGGRGDFTALQPSFSHDFTKYVQAFKQRWGTSTPAREQKEKEVFLPFLSRQYDICYIGIINHGSTRELYGVNEHRQMAVDAIERLKMRHPELRVYTGSSGKLKYSEFIQLLKDSKVFVSPFGLGEFSGKDYEALLSGTLLVKPAAEKLQTYPNIYLSNSTINVNIDFSNLEEAVMPFLQSPSKARRRIRDAHEELKRYAKVEQFTQDLHRFLFDYLQRPVTYDPRGCYASPTWFFDERGIRKPSAIIRSVAAQRLEQGLPVYDPDPVIDGDEIMLQLEEEEELRRAGVAFEHQLSKVPLVDAASRHTDVLASYSQIVNSNNQRASEFSAKALGQ